MMTVTSEFPAKWDYDTDIIVVGFGGAGASAAIEAHDKGATVLIIDKSSVAGGTTAISGGIIAGAGTSLQRARGISDSPEEMYRYFRACGRGLDDPDLTRVLSENSGTNIEWLIILI